MVVTLKQKEKVGNTKWKKRQDCSVWKFPSC